MFLHGDKASEERERKSREEQRFGKKEEGTRKSREEKRFGKKEEGRTKNEERKGKWRDTSVRGEDKDSPFQANTNMTQSCACGPSPGVPSERTVNPGAMGASTTDTFSSPLPPMGPKATVGCKKSTRRAHATGEPETAFFASTVRAN